MAKRVSEFHSSSSQHKPQRDEQKAKELRELKQENRALKKQLSKLRKQLAKLIDKHGLETIDCSVDDEESCGEDLEPVVLKESCPQCGAEVTELLLSSLSGLKTFKACTNKRCLWRKRVS